MAGARLSFSPHDAWKVTLNAGQSRDFATTYYQGTSFGEYYPLAQTGYTNSRRNQASWQNDIAYRSMSARRASAGWKAGPAPTSTAVLAR